MFSTLLELHRAGSRSSGGTAFSLFAHAAIVATVVIATHRDVSAGDEPVRTPEDVVTFQPPRPPLIAAPPRVDAMPPMRGIEILIAPVAIPDVLPAINHAQPATDVAYRPVRIGHADAPGDGPGGPASREFAGGVFDWRQVEKQALQVPGVGVPVYPELLKEAGFSGEVVVSFVIDTTGRAEVGTLRVLRATRPEFTKAVRDAVPHLRFLPAESGGRRVRQLVELPFLFTVR